MTHTTLLAKMAIGAGAIALGFGVVAGASAFGGGYGQDLTDAQREIIDQAHELRVEGEYEAAQALLEQNNMERGFGGKGRRGEMNENRVAQMQERHEMMGVAREAIENNDYAAFVAARPDNANAPEISAETFAQIVKAHNLHEAGDDEGARAIMEELGFPMRQGHGYGNQDGSGYRGMGANKGVR
jgi:hypothetical protein